MSEIQHRASQNFERVKRIAQRVGVVLAVVGIALAIADITGLFEWQPNEPLYLLILRQGSIPIGGFLLIYAYAYPRMVPMNRKPATEAEQRVYRGYLYRYSRPMKEQLGELVLVWIFLMPALGVLLVAVIASRVWPEQQRVITVIAILAEVGAFVFAASQLQKHRRWAIDNWYTEKFTIDGVQKRPESIEIDGTLSSSAPKVISAASYGLGFAGIFLLVLLAFSELNKYTVVIGGMSLLCLLTGWGMHYRRQWARILTMLFSGSLIISIVIRLIPKANIGELLYLLLVIGGLGCAIYWLAKHPKEFR